MFIFKNKFTITLFILVVYQTSLFSKSISFNEFNSKNLSRYFSGIVAFENNDNSEALNFFRSSKILINHHDPYLERFIMSLVLEDKVLQAINIIKNNTEKDNSNFFEAYILLSIDSLKKNDINKSFEILAKVPENLQEDRLRFIILNSLKQYLYTFRDKVFQNNNQNFGNLSLISETFQRCYLNDEKTSTFFSELIKNPQADYSRYIYFYLTYLIENNQIKQAKKIVADLDYINLTLLISQGKSWIDRNKPEEFGKVFSCNNHNHVLGEFLFLISNLYSSQNKFEQSNFYLSLSNYLNPNFVFNLSLVAENFYLNGNYEKSKTILENFDKNQDFYYWFRVKKEAQIISKTKNQTESLNYITSKFKNFKNPNNKLIFDIANFYKNSKEYNQAIKYYSIIINSLSVNDEVKADLLYRRGGTYERLKDYENADKDLLESLKINPDDAYVLNYLAYSWLERDYRINDAIKMLEKAYSKKNEDPYIIDSLGWAYYLIEDFVKAEKFLKIAVQLMPDDPIVNDHYGDILWKLNRKIQARYFWLMVLEMENVQKELINDIQNKIIIGPKRS